MKIGRKILEISLAAAVLLLSPLSSEGQTLEEECRYAAIHARKTMGFEECSGKCFIQRCGPAGLRCPTVEQKELNRSICDGKCRNLMDKQEELRELARFCRQLELERKRAELAVEKLKKYHKLWMEKRALLLRLERERRKLSDANSGDSQGLQRRLEELREKLSQIFLEKLNAKEEFYRHRLNFRKRQIEILRRQIAELKEKLRTQKALAREKKLAFLERLKRKVREREALREKERKLRIRLFKSQLLKKEVQLKELEKQRKNLERAKASKGNSNEELSKKLGQLAAQRVRLLLEKRKLQKKLSQENSGDK